VRPSSSAEFVLALHRLQLAALEATAELWWASGRELWMPRGAVPRRSGPSLAEMVRETKSDTYDGDSAA
jgi:hypothetical protein